MTASRANQTCSTAITTSLALIEQFQKSLYTSNVSNNVTVDSSDHPSPLLLLKAAAESLKSTTTKLSLLSLTPPFTDTAVTSLLKPLNDSILPSLVTACLLVTPSQFPDSFAAETTHVTNTALSEIRLLLELVERRAKDGRPNTEPSKPEKKGITETTGRVWEACDRVIEFSTHAVSGFVVKKVDEWLDLMKDAVQELKDWDPAEDVDEDLFGHVDSGDDEETNTYTDKAKDEDQATIAAGVKDQALRVLARIPQTIHVVVKQRLAKMPKPFQYGEGEGEPYPKHKHTFDIIIKNTRLISECIDESAEAMYFGNPELCLKKAGEARALTIEVVELVLPPWQARPGDAEPSKEDTFIKRALLWIEQVDTRSTSNGEKG